MVPQLPAPTTATAWLQESPGSGLGFGFAVIALFRHLGQGDHPLFRFGVHEFHALGDPADERMPRVAIRRILPPSVTSMISSSSFTWRMPITRPVRVVMLSPLHPLAAPVVLGVFGVGSVRLPKPRSVTVRIVPSGLQHLHAHHFVLAGPTSMPLTPRAARPMSRTSDGREADDLALAGPQEDALLRFAQGGAHHFVPGIQGEGDDAAAPGPLRSSSGPSS